MTMGIYAIRNTVTGDRYVGSSRNIEARVEQHVRRLTFEANRPAGPIDPFVRVRVDHFVEAWREYGSDAFEVDVLEEHTDEIAMRTREQSIIASEPCLYNKYTGKSSLRINYPRKTSTAS